jgi:hypothetical protein
MSRDTDLATVLVGADPKLAASRLLGHLIKRYRAAGGLVVRLRDGQLVSFASCDVPLERDQLVVEQWTKHRNLLAKGEALRGPGWVLAPLRAEGALVGAVFLDAPADDFDSGSAPFLMALGQAAVHPDPGPDLGIYFMAMPAEEVEKEHLVRTLDANEWNVSRVARLLGLARRTIYLRLERYNIPRKRVPKTLKIARAPKLLKGDR